MPPYVVIEPVFVGGQVFSPGAVISLTGEAAALLSLGKIKPQGSEPTPPPSPVFGYKVGTLNFYLGIQPPTSGTYAKGDRVLNTSPDDGGFEGWVCTVAGSPGTWVGYGKAGGGTGSPDPSVSETVVCNNVTELRQLSLSSRNPGFLYTTNVALNKTATATSNASGQEPAKGIDGNLGTVFASGVASPTESWTVDLGANHTIIQLTIIPQFPNLQTGVIFTGSLTSDFASPIALGTISGTVTGNAVLNISATNLRYIKLTNPTAQLLHFFEFQAQGVLTSSIPGGNTSLLHLLTPVVAPKRYIKLLGYYSSGDGGGGNFILDGNDINSPDDGGLVFVCQNQDRIKRVVEGSSLNVLWFGTKNSGLASDGDQSPKFVAAIQAASNYTYSNQQPLTFKNSMRVEVPPGNYYCTTTIDIQGTQSLILSGTGRTTFWWYGAANANLFTLRNYAYTSFENFNIELRKPCYAAIELRNEGGSPTATRFAVKDVHIDVIYDSGSATPYDGKQTNFGLLMTPLGAGGDNNNDLPSIDSLYISGVNIGYYVQGFNAHNICARRFGVNNCNWGIVGWTGYLRLHEYGSGNIKYADIYLRQNAYPTYIYGANCEHSGCFMMVEEADAPIVVENLRFDSSENVGENVFIINASNSDGVHKTPISIRNSVFNNSSGRILILGGTGTDKTGWRNLATVENCFWNKTNYLDNTPILQVSSQICGDTLHDIFGIGSWTITQSQVDTTNNTLDLGFDHGLPNNTYCTSVNRSQYGVQGDAGYFIKRVTGQSTKIQLLASVGGTPITLQTGNGNLFFRILGAVRRPILDLVAKTAGSPVTVFSNRIPVLPRVINSTAIMPSGYVDLSYSPKSNSFNTFTLKNVTATGVQQIAKIKSPGLFQVTVDWGVLDSAMKSKTFIVGLSDQQTEGIWYATPSVMSSGAGFSGVVLYQQFNTVVKYVNSTEPVITLALNFVDAGDYVISISSLGGTATGYLDVEQISGSVSIASASLPPQQAFPLLTSPSGIQGNLFFQPVTTSATDYTPDLSQSNNFLINLSGATTIRNPINVSPECEYRFTFTQPGTAQTVTFEPAYNFASGDTAAVTASANVKDILICKGNPNGTLDCYWKKNFAIISLPSKSVAAQGWKYDFDAINVNLSNVSSGKVGSLTDAINSQAVTEATNRFNYVTSQLNGKPALQSTATNSVLSNANLSLTNTYTALVCFSLNSLSSGTAVWESAGTSIGGVTMQVSGGGFGLYAGGGGLYASSFTASTGAIYTVVVRVNGASSQLYLNGTLLVTGDPGGNTIPSGVGLALGTLNNGTANGFYYKWLFADGLLTNTQINNTIATMKQDRPGIVWTNI